MSYARMAAAMEATPEFNCGTCALRDRCPDKRKSRRFRCTMHAGAAVKGDPASRQFLDLMRDLVKKESVLPDSFNLDDRSSPEAANFYQWTVGRDFMKMRPPPYPWQMEMGLKIFGDICCYCGDADWREEIPYDCDVREIPQRLSLRRFGRCPKCDKTKLDGIRSGREGDVNTFFGSVGQRSGKCVSGSSLVPTERGVVFMRDVKVGDRAFVDGAYHDVSAVMLTRDRPTITATTESGYFLRATPDHPVLTPDNWQKLSKATHLKITSIPTHRLTMQEWRASRHERPDKFDEAFAMSMPEEIAVRDIRERVIEEFGTNTHALVLRFYSDLDAKWTQQHLLGFGIFCSRTADRLSIASPWSIRYFKHIGIKNRSVAQFIWNARKCSVQPLPKETCRMVMNLLGVQGLHKMGLTDRPGELRVAQETLNHATYAVLTKADAAKAARALRRLPADDWFIRSMLVSLLEGAARSEFIWDEIATRKNSRKDTVYDIEVPTAKRFIANGAVVHNSTGIGLVISYHTHKLLKLKNPSAFYRIKAGTILHNNIIGIDYTGAKQNVFDPLMASIEDAPWWQNYHALLEETARRRGDDELFRIKDGFIFYKPAGLWLSPVSPSRRSLRGRTRSGFVVDEMDHFSENTKLVNISGLEVWRACTRSLGTIRPAVNRLHRDGVVNVPPGLACGISSAWSVSSPLTTLMNGAIRGKDKNTFYMRRPTWEANPDITFEDLKQEMRADPVSFWRDFGCRPPFSAASFINGLDPYNDVVRPKSLAAFTQKTYAARAGSKRTKRFTAVRLTWRWKDSTPRILAMDAGRTKNSFGLAVAHIDTDGYMVYDGFVEIRPRHEMPVGYEHAYLDVISPIIKELNVVAVATDRWQNNSILDRILADFKIETIAYSLKYGDFTDWRDHLLRGDMSLPRPEEKKVNILNIDGPEESALDDRPVAQFLRQSIRVVDVPGKTVEKPETGNDDCFRSGVLAHAVARQPEVAALLTPSAVKKRAGAIGAIAGGSRGMATPLSSGVAVVSRSLAASPVFRN